MQSAHQILLQAGLVPSFWHLHPFIQALGLAEARAPHVALLARFSGGPAGVEVSTSGPHRVEQRSNIEKNGSSMDHRL